MFCCMYVCSRDVGIFDPVHDTQVGDHHSARLGRKLALFMQSHHLTRVLSATVL
jgi:hypothetical protein